MLYLVFNQNEKKYIYFKKCLKTSTNSTKQKVPKPHGTKRINANIKYENN